MFNLHRAGEWGRVHDCFLLGRFSFRSSHCFAAVFLNRVFQVVFFSVRRASSCNTPRPSLNGCSASSSCFFMGLLPSSFPACQEIQWWCWREEAPWDLLGENTRWMRWEGPVCTHNHIHTNLKACPCCSLLAHVDATQLPHFIPFQL